MRRRKTPHCSERIDDVFRQSPRTIITVSWRIRVGLTVSTLTEYVFVNCLNVLLLKYSAQPPEGCRHSKVVVPRRWPVFRRFQSPWKHSVETILLLWSSNFVLDRVLDLQPSVSFLRPRESRIDSVAGVRRDCCSLERTFRSASRHL